jgi:dimeric dUTPase (all-alpha-NTP-PPase superfamily)
MLDLTDLYKLQNDLDELIVNNTYNKCQFLSIAQVDANEKFFLLYRITALFTEVAEFANATRCFKYWSNKPPESRERTIDEYVDMLHFWLSIGNTMGYAPVEVEQAYLKKYEENKKRQLENY